jgi:hypothetical protein
MDRKNIPKQAPSIPETPQQTPKDPLIFFISQSSKTT